jgi:hypothetical protein
LRQLPFWRLGGTDEAETKSQGGYHDRSRGPKIFFGAAAIRPTAYAALSLRVGRDTEAGGDAAGGRAVAE